MKDTQKYVIRNDADEVFIFYLTLEQAQAIKKFIEFFDLFFEIKKVDEVTIPEDIEIFY
jgi:hypothetical protein